MVVFVEGLPDGPGGAAVAGSVGLKLSDFVGHPIEIFGADSFAVVGAVVVEKGAFRFGAFEDEIRPFWD